MMRRIRSIGLIRGLLFIACFGWSAQGYAYIPPSHFILKTWVNKHNSVKRLKIRTLVTAYEKNQATPDHFKETMIVQADHQTVKSWATNDADQVLYYQEKPLISLSPVFKLLLSSDVGDVTRSLREKGIPIRIDSELSSFHTEAEKLAFEQESLMRWNQSAAWVIAHKPLKKDGPQLWIEKDSFNPVKIVYLNTADREDYDFRMGSEGFRYYHDFPFPRMMLVVKKQTETLFGLQLSDLSGDLEVGSLNRVQTPGMTAAGNSAPPDVKDLLKLYYEVIR